MSCPVPFSYLPSILSSSVDNFLSGESRSCAASSTNSAYFSSNDDEVSLVSYRHPLIPFVITEINKSDELIVTDEPGFVTVNEKSTGIAQVISRHRKMFYFIFFKLNAGLPFSQQEALYLFLQMRRGREGLARNPGEQPKNVSGGELEKAIVCVAVS